MMSPREYAFCFLVFAMATGCSTTPDPPTEPIDDNAIVPYSRIGKLALGINEATLLKWMGVPERTIGNAYYYFRDGEQELRVSFDGGKAYDIATISPRFATADGIRVGSSELEVRAAWGPPIKSREVVYEPEFIQYCFRNGFQVNVDQAHRVVTQIGVNYRCSIP